jgi:hypothetical protein
MKARDARRRWTAFMRNEQKEAMLPWNEIRDILLEFHGF